MIESLFIIVTTSFSLIAVLAFIGFLFCIFNPNCEDIREARVALLIFLVSGILAAINIGVAVKYVQPGVQEAEVNDN